MRTSNPALNDRTFEGLGEVAAQSQAMTLQGTVAKTALLLAIVAGSGAMGWGLIEKHGIALVAPYLIGIAIAALVIGIIGIRAKTWATILAPCYAIAEGFVLGAISNFYEKAYQGIVPMAVGLTLGVAFALLLAYTSRLIRPSENFKLGVTAATGGIFLFYLVVLGLGFFGIQVPHIFGSGWIGIGFSLFVVALAAMNLVLDFDFIENGCQRGAPKYMEWCAAFGLLVTVVWLYVEILRLLAKLRNR